MRFNLKQSFIRLCFISFLGFAFSGCLESPHHTILPPLPSTGDGGDALFTENDLLRFDKGKAVYDQNCRSCHSTHSLSTKRNRNLEQINTAIQAIPTMRFIRFANSTDGEDLAFSLKYTRKEIEDYLRDNSPDPLPPHPPAEDEKISGTTFDASRATRHLIASKFRYLFIDPNHPASADSIIESKINSFFMNQPSFMGGFCHELDPDCAKINNNHTENQEAKMTGSSSALRSGYLSRACNEILAMNSSVENVLRKTNIQLNDNIDANSVEKVWNLFLPSHSHNVYQESNKSVLDALIEVSNQASTNGQNKHSQWRHIMTSICDSPLMESI